MTLTARALVLSALFGLSACGFQPLYAERTGLAETLSDIEVVTGDGRPAYQLGLALRDRLGGWSGNARYRLEANADMRRTAQSVTVADIATRYEVEMQVRYVLIDQRSGETIRRGSASGSAGFDVPRDPYAAIRAEQNSETRAAQQAAEAITNALALWLRDYESE